MPENNKAQFFIDEFFFQDLSVSPIDWCEQVTDFLEVAEDIQNSPLQPDFKPILWASDLFWETELRSGRRLDELLFTDFYRDSLTRDEVIRLQRILSQSSQFIFSELPRIEGAQANGHGKTKCETYNFGGLLTNRDSEFLNASEHWDQTHHFPIRSKDELEYFYRRWIVSTSQPENVFFEYSCLAFKNTFFHNTLNFNSFSDRYENLLPCIVEHLSFLNDSIQNIFIEQKNQPNQITAHASASNIDVSPESPQTHRNASAMREREVDVSGENICCEWHTKIFLDKDRIHFHPGLNQSEEVDKVTCGRVIVGIFAEHLST